MKSEAAKAGKAEVGIDSIKVYLWGMGALTVVTSVWLAINFFLLRQYQGKWDESAAAIEEILALEAKMPQNVHSEVDLDNPFQFFLRGVHALPEVPVVEVDNWKVGNERQVEFEEKTYLVRFRSIDRRNLVRYVYSVEKQKPFLVLKELDMERAEQTPAYDDAWRADLVFASRRPTMKAKSD